MRALQPSHALRPALRRAAAPPPRAEPHAAPCTGTSEFDGGVGIAAFRPPAPLPRRGPALGKSGRAAFDSGSGAAAFAAGPPPSSLQAKLRRYGLAGVLAYGVLNTAWYAVAFASAWSVGAGSPRALGLRAALAKGAEVLAYAWAGSQVTKAARLAAAVALAPVADRALGALQTAAGLRTKRAAFGVAVAGLCAVATIVMVVTVGTAV